MKRTHLIAVALALASLVGCAATQHAIDSAQDWVDKPATTQPGSPTHGQVIQTTVDAGGAFVPGWGTAATSAVGIALYALRKLSSKDHATIIDKVDAIAAVVNPPKVALAPGTLSPTVPATQPTT